jgi:hypothetical protein
MYHFVGTLSAEYCSKNNFPHKDDLGLISNSWETVKKALFVLIMQTTKLVPYLLSPTPSSGCQAKGFEISIANKIK